MKRSVHLAIVAALVAGLVPLAAVGAGASTVGNRDACTPGFWKNHTNSWEEYGPSTSVAGQFQIPGALAGQVPATFLDALQGGGGKGVVGGATILLRAAVQSFLNAAHDSLEYPLQRDQGPPPTLRQRINAALASLDRDTMLSLATELDDLANRLNCPLGGDNTNSGN